MAYKKSNPNGQATMANSEPVVIASDQSAVPVTAPAVADTGNSTTTPLGAGANFTGTAFDMNAYSSWSVNVFADQASSTNGFKIQWSDDGTNWDFTDQTTYVASVGNMVTFGRKARYVRVNFTNGTTPQGAFRVTAYAQPFAVRQTRKFIGTSLTDADTGQVVVAALQGHTTAGGGGWVDVKVDPSGAIATAGKVTATDLDIRNLTSTDVVTVTGGAGQTADVRVTLDGESVPVTGTFWQATQPVSGTVTANTGLSQPLTDTQLRASAVPVSLASVPSHAVTNAGTFAVQSTNQANSGVDIGDVTINNSTGAAAVNIQDGGNTITVDGTVSVTGSTIQDIPATSGGLSKFHLVGAATTNLTNIKASAGQVYSITAFNVAATPIYIKFHNTAGSPTAGSGVTDTFLVPGNTAGAGVVINFDKGIAFSTGIAISTVTGIADADTTAIAASSLVLNIYYK